jgi:hypothetical protein
VSGVGVGGGGGSGQRGELTTGVEVEMEEDQQFSQRTAWPRAGCVMDDGLVSLFRTEQK